MWRTVFTWVIARTFFGDEETTYHELCLLVREEVEQLKQNGKALPAPGTRPMKEAVLA